MRLLVVEDNKKIRDLLKRCLEAECFAVDVAVDGEEGLYLAQVNEYDTIILDNLMPKKTGVELCQELRAAGSAIPVLMLSVQSDTNFKVEALEAGADDYLIKPFSFAELRARVRALQRRQSNFIQNVLEACDLTLDAARQSVVKNGQELRLTRKEFMLLEYFMRNRSIVLSRGMIMEHVWDMNADPFSNTIESHIFSLRKKIGDDNKQRIIQTIPGRGYRFD